jgi:hypothetical protein
MKRQGTQAKSWKERIAEDEEHGIVFKLPIESYSLSLGMEAARVYRAYIASRHWTTRKEAYYATRPRECAICESPRVDLNHKYYGNYGFEKDEDLVPLCRVHHEALHREIGVHKDMRYATEDYIEWQRDLLERSE